MVMDLDLEKFFDRVDHDLLLGRLAQKIGDRRVLQLIRRYLQAGMMAEGLVSPSVRIVVTPPRRNSNITC
jgi:retron-type reverse transcriptase